MREHKLIYTKSHETTKSSECPSQSLNNAKSLSIRPLHSTRNGRQNLKKKNSKNRSARFPLPLLLMEDSKQAKKTISSFISIWTFCLPSKKIGPSFFRQIYVYVCTVLCIYCTSGLVIYRRQDTDLQCIYCLDSLYVYPKYINLFRSSLVTYA